MNSFVTRKLWMILSFFLENNFSCGNGNSRDFGDCNYLTTFLFSASFIFLNVRVERGSNKISQETGLMRHRDIGSLNTRFICVMKIPHIKLPNFSHKNTKQGLSSPKLLRGVCVCVFCS